MARNREPSMSESGEEDESSCEEVESDSEPKQTATATPKKSQPQLPVKSQQPPPPAQSQPPSSSEEEESGSETSSDSDGADSNVKPLASKPMEEAHGARRTRSKANSPEAVTLAKPSAAKRPCEDTVASKDAKKIADPKASEKKPIPFHRLWSEEDEIIILKGMIEYSSKNNCDIDPIPDMDGFGDFIKKSLHIEKFSRIQLKDKIKKQKAKYKEKEKEGTERRFGKLHEQSVYELSKEIWFRENGVSSPKANGSVGRKKTKRAMVVEGERLNLNLNPNASGEERMLRSGREIYEKEQGVEGEEEWSKLGVEEWELYLKQLELRIAQTKLVLNAIKGGGGDHH